MPNIFEVISEGLRRAPKAIVDAWTGGSGAVGTPEEVDAVVAEIRSVTIGGYTLYVFTASDAAWAVPPALANATQAWAGVVGGSSRGFTGLTEENIENLMIPGGEGGIHGGYIVNPFDPLTLGGTLAIVIGAGAASPGGTGGASSITNGATVLALSIPGISALATPQGDVALESAPGNGGQGGSAMVPASAPGCLAFVGRPGGATTAAAGGTGGAPSMGNGAGTAGAGTAGSAGRIDAHPIRGGSGGAGGGGASRYGGNATGGTGGAGGYPGGAPGGGGAAVSNGTIYSQTGGAPGPTTNGLAWILCR